MEWGTGWAVLASMRCLVVSRWSDFEGDGRDDLAVMNRREPSARRGREVVGLDRPAARPVERRSGGLTALAFTAAAASRVYDSTRFAGAYED
ncbi:hypothetical protein ACIA8I_17990 [Streptomyces rishiriensis]|uniref:hypothetical protein n=1 Tax=Streptomyces rishiriensis TaxID=68264 RepID=UPI0037BD9385